MELARYARFGDSGVDMFGVVLRSSEFLSAPQCLGVLRERTPLLSVWDAPTDGTARPIGPDYTRAVRFRLDPTLDARLGSRKLGNSPDIADRRSGVSLGNIGRPTFSRKERIMPGSLSSIARFRGSSDSPIHTLREPGTDHYLDLLKN